MPPKHRLQITSNSLPLTPEMLQIPTRIAQEQAARFNYGDVEELESVAWCAFGKGYVSFNSERARYGDDSLANYLVICCRRDVCTFLIDRRTKRFTTQCKHRVTIVPERREDYSGRHTDVVDSHIRVDRRIGKVMGNPYEEIQSRETLHIITNSLHPPILATICRMVLEGLDQWDIARELGISVSLARYRLRQMRKQVREITGSTIGLRREPK